MTKRSLQRLDLVFEEVAWHNAEGLLVAAFAQLPELEVLGLEPGVNTIWGALRVFRSAYTTQSQDVHVRRNMLGGYH